MIQQHTIATPYMVGDVHFYTARLKGELTLFDTGPPTEAAWTQLQNEVDLGELRHIFVTHCHIDHWGNAAKLVDKTGARLYLPQRDADKITHHQQRLKGMMMVMRGYGFQQRYLDQLLREIDSDATFPPFPPHYDIVETSRQPARLGIRVLACPGHSQSDLVYRVGNQAVSGDVLLRGIFQSPLLDVDLQTFTGRFHNYRAYCGSLNNLAGLRDCQILPGHRYTIDTVDATVLFYLRKLLDRAHKLKPYATEQDVASLIEKLFSEKDLPLFHIYLKASEIIFMQDLLLEPQRLRNALEKIELFATLADKFDALH